MARGDILFNTRIARRIQYLFCLQRLRILYAVHERMTLQSLLVALLLFRRSISQIGDLQIGACYADINCTGRVIDLQAQNTAKHCCVGTSDGRSYSYDSDCTVRSCIGELQSEH